MKKYFVLLAFVATTLLAEQRTLMVVSDMHVMDTTLWDISNPQILYHDHKMPEHSCELWDSAVARILQAKPDILLIPGDLTYNGELLSHQYVASKLALIKANGTQVFVIPGNHDVSDPAARSFKNATTLPAKNLSAEGFATLYADYGYGNAVARLDSETDSLSYMAYPTDDIALIALNTNQSNLNGHQSAGGITAGAMAFLQQCTERALADGHTNILLMLHHPVMEHFDGHARMDKNHIGNQVYGITPLSDVQEMLTAAHVHAVFSGHAHLHTIAHIGTQNGELYDISTGSLSAYPCPMRRCTLDTETGELSIEGEEITIYQNEAYQRDTLLAQGAVNAITEAIYPRLEDLSNKINSNIALKMVFGNAFNNIDKQGLKSLVWQFMGTEIHHALCALSRGDENIYFPNDSAYNAAVGSFYTMATAFLGMDFQKAQPILEKFGIVPNLGFTPEDLFGSIYGNYVTLDEDEVVTPDASCTILSGIKVREQRQITAIESINNEDVTTPRKQLRNGRLVIIMGDKTYNVLGQTE
ncbi:MAG: metallophosphoesterase [Paludibacteraceae bacterium]|nr:metallophosphoesterase [Paludibacteraceae bacterium]